MFQLYVSPKAALLRPVRVWASISCLGVSQFLIRDKTFKSTSLDFYKSFFTIFVSFFLATSSLQSCSDGISQKIPVTENAVINKPIAASVLFLDISKSASNTYKIPQLSLSQLNDFIDMAAHAGGMYLFIYVIDDDARDNSPIYINIPAITIRHQYRGQQLGDEMYESELEEERKQFQQDSLSEVQTLNELKSKLQKQLSAFLDGAYMTTTKWTDINGAINNAITVLSAPKYQSSPKYIIALSDLEHSLPENQSYKPVLLQIPENIRVLQICSSTTGMYSPIKNVEKIPMFDLVINYLSPEKLYRHETE